MIDVTNRHCRYFHRLLAPRARLYTEMIHTGALLYGKTAQHLDFDRAEHPLALQLGGNDPTALARAARLGEKWGYDEINLNCGCPSDRVQRGAFGACLMNQPTLVADCVKAMRDAVSVPITVKHRLGLDYDTSLECVLDFMSQLYKAGCQVFIVHARNAVLDGLSPRNNREIPPLRYPAVKKLKQYIPGATIVLNGGLADTALAIEAANTFDGIMLGRAAWHHPRVLSEINSALWPTVSIMTDQEIVEIMTEYAVKEVTQGTPLHRITKPMLGWFNGYSGARQWRRQLSDYKSLASQAPTFIRQVWESLRPCL